eukprot:CAMPEP_0114363188 /NCGR_PEP_ID=MMETSP0101-20121206/26364_1 /TAXON_ID=38822 ORGANISM="Pteridomonas danica, Strain PT" /NCGR_SAMPLE_ID=MMETSP0101 /ASSEMBLY_ACC=CAM_ASM_000211 /LENGTH=1347 /DNA_ID=CAMNT_0001509675 /DNA_START=1 /DNA_END=4044 /DNA_ORIENTATION=-
MIYWFPIILTINFFDLTSQAEILFVEEGVERPTPWYFMVETPDPEECATQCLDAEFCQSWNWNKRSKDCFLNKEDVPPRPRIGSFSGVVRTSSTKSDVDAKSDVDTKSDVVKETLIEALNKPNLIGDIFSVTSVFGSKESHVHQITSITPDVPMVMGPSLGMSEIIRLDKSIPFTFTLWVWLWQITPLNVHQKQSTKQVVLFSTTSLSDSVKDTGIGLAPNILLNVGTDPQLQRQFYFATQASGDDKKVEYHGQFSGVEAPIGQWTHLALTYSPESGSKAFVNGQLVVEETPAPWGSGTPKTVSLLAQVGGQSGHMSSPCGLVSGARMLNGKALSTSAVILEMEQTRPVPPPTPLLAHISMPVRFSSDYSEFSQCLNNKHSGIDIVFAQYRPVGAARNQGKDVTAQIKHLTRCTVEGASLMDASAQSFNEVLGDPFPNIQKELYVQWRQHSLHTKSDQIREGVWGEGERFDLRDKRTCPSPTRASAIPYFLFASWSDWTEHGEGFVPKPDITTRVTSQDLVDSGMALVAGPLSEPHLNGKLRPTGCLPARVIEENRKHYAQSITEGNTTTLLNSNSKWLKEEWEPLMTIASSSALTCARACHIYQPPILKPQRMCQVWEFHKESSQCIMLAHQGGSRPRTLSFERGWIAGVRPGSHQPVTNFPTPAKWRRDLSDWCFRFALLVNSAHIVDALKKPPAQEVAAMTLAFRLLHEDSDMVKQVSEHILDSPIKEVEEVSHLLVNEILGEAGVRRRARASEFEMARPLFEKFEAVLRMASQFIDSTDENQVDDEADGDIIPSIRSQQEIRLQQTTTQVSSSLKVNMVATYYVFAASWVTRHWGSTSYSPMGTPEALFLDKQEVSINLGVGGMGDDSLFQFQQMRADGNQDAEAQLWLGRQHYWGRGGVPRDRGAAAGYFRAAAQGGAVEAFYDLGIMLLNGDGVPRNPLEAVRHFRQAANAGVDAAHNGLGALYLNPQHLIAATVDASVDDREAIMQEFGMKPNKTAAMYHFQQAKNSDAMYSLGNLYREGYTLVGMDMSPRRFERALESYARSASMGHPRALATLGAAFLDDDSWIAQAGRERERLDLSRFIVQVELPRSPRSTGDASIVVDLPLQKSPTAALGVSRILAEMGPWSSFHLNQGISSYNKAMASSLDIDRLAHLSASAWHFGVGAEFGLAMASTNEVWLHQWPNSSMDSPKSYTQRLFDYLLTSLNFRSPLILPGKPEEYQKHITCRTARAAADGDPHALRKLADFALTSNQHVLAVGYYEEAADLGDSESIFALSRLAHQSLQSLNVFSSQDDSKVNHTLVISELHDHYHRCLKLGGDGVWPARLGLLQLELQSYFRRFF